MGFINQLITMGHHLVQGKIWKSWLKLRNEDERTEQQ